MVSKNLPKDDTYNYLNIKTGILWLKDFKTSGSFNDVKMYINNDTLFLIRTYLFEMEKITGNLPSSQYLIMKNDGSPYKDGKLSSYIIDMFERHTGAKLSINDLRHSVATYHRNSPQRVKEFISNMLHHSFKQHVMYERHSDRHLEFPILQNKMTTELYGSTSSYIGERVAILETRKDTYNNQHTVILIGTIVGEMGDSVVVKFHNRTMKQRNYKIPHKSIIIL